MLAAVLNSGFGKALGGALGSSAPSSATNAVYGNGLDGSGWTVNFSGVTNANPSKSGDGLTTGGISPLVWIGAAVLAGVLIYRAKKS
jgi:hypothetical protein